MFVTYEQFFVFALTFALGYTFGVIYGVLVLPLEYLKSIVLKSIVSVIICLLFAFVLYLVFISAEYPNFRLYMPFAVFFGFCLERKNLHLLLALFYKKLYNQLKSQKS